jgi:phosphoribosyl-dephospho-CoA transferase
MRKITQTSPCWKRHDLVHVAPDIWASALARCPSSADLPLVEAWADRGWPAIVRRRGEVEDPGLVPVGVPLPPAMGKHRVALAIPPEGVLQRWSPPSLRAAASVADPGCRSTIGSLLSLGARTGVEPSAFGSLLWEHLTGLAYLSPHSDLDVLWSVAPSLDVLSPVVGIAEIQREAPRRIDGEVMFSDGGAVNWRELLAAMNEGKSGEVLVKSIDSVRLVNVSQLLNLRRVA